MIIRGQPITGFPFGLINKTTGDAVTTGVCVGYYLLDGGAQQPLTNLPVHEGNGQWSVDLEATETDGEVLGLLFVHPLAISAPFTIQTQTADESTAPTSSSETMLCNDALGQFGESPITSVDDGTVNADWCKTFLPKLRDSLLREHDWRFARANAELAQDAVAVSPSWAYSYTLPVDCLKIRLYSGSAATVMDLAVAYPDIRFLVSYQLQGNHLLTNDGAAFITYTKQVVNPSLWDPLFYQVMATWLAAKLAAATIKGSEGRKIGADLLNEAVNVLLPSAKAVDSQEEPHSAYVSDELTWGR